MSIDLSTLNDSQRRAALWDHGPMLVLAGPGSGKTRVLTTRVARILQEDPDAAVLALSFTTKAAAEMRDRVDRLLRHRAERAHLCTFHAYAAEILRQHGSHIGLRPDFVLLTVDGDRLSMLQPILRELEAEGHELPEDHQSLLRLLDHLLREAYDGAAIAPGLATTPTWVPELFRRYGEALVASNRQDFGSMLWFAGRLLREKPGVARVIRLGWSHVCVDEFQDTNNAQYELLKLLAPPPRANLFVVADDDQILYQWNGASPESLQVLRADYDAELVQLPASYRCPPEIIHIANRLIANNKRRTPGKLPLEAQRPPGGGGTVRREVFPTPEAEAAGVADLIAARGVEARQCVVLGRTARILDGVAAALSRKGLVPYLARRKSDFETPVVRVVIAALRLANARHDREVMRRLCVAWEEASGHTIVVENVAATATLMGGDFLRAWCELVGEKGTRREVGLVHRLQTSLVGRLDFPEVIDGFLKDGHAHWKIEGNTDLEDEVAIWRELHAQFEREQGPQRAPLNVYLQTMDLASKVPPPPPGAIPCLTVHGAKGLEFKHVYLVGLAQEVLPSFQALRRGPESREMEEERRSCFVAITRAWGSLTLTRSTEYYGWPKGPSQFLSEMFSEEA